MEWSRPTQQGEIPSPRAGHAGVTLGESWFIVGGGDNKSGMDKINNLRMLLIIWMIVVENLCYTCVSLNAGLIIYGNGHL